MKLAPILCGLLLGLGLAAPAGADPAPQAASRRIFIASDSTAANYAADQYPQMGWGMFLRCSAKPDIDIVNLAKGGRSTKTFIEEGLWADLLGRLVPGDTVLIQFGHNDEDLTKMYRHTEPDSAFRDNLTRFVADVRSKGAEPVLMTPIARDEFVGGTLQETHGRYGEVVREVASATASPLIDLNAASMAFLQAAGEAGSKRYFMIFTPADHVARFPEGHVDTTHLNEMGARAAAGLVAQGLAGLGLPVSRDIQPLSPAAATALGGPACG